MPNWCSTNYTLVGEKEEVNDLYKKMKFLEDRDHPLVQNGFGNTWLGCLVMLLGGEPEKIGCRGEWSSLSIDEPDVLSFSTETAWYRCTDVENLIKVNYPSIQIYFICEESGMCIYEKYDSTGRYFPERFLLDFEDGDMDYYVSEESLMTALDDIFGVGFHTMEDVNEFMQEHNDGIDDGKENGGGHIWLNEFKEVDFKN